LELIVEGMQSKTLDEQRKFYKSIAKQLHPDKNSHPLAKEAF
jgi:curved DNA-binding protein CbpA